VARTHLQDVAIVAAVNSGRVVAWFDEIPRAKTHTPHVAVLAAARGLTPRNDHQYVPGT
jgi:transposase